MEDQKLIEALENLAGQIDENTAYLEKINHKLDDIDEKLAVIIRDGVTLDQS